MIMFEILDSHSRSLSCEIFILRYKNNLTSNASLDLVAATYLKKIYKGEVYILQYLAEFNTL